MCFLCLDYEACMSWNINIMIKVVAACTIYPAPARGDERPWWGSGCALIRAGCCFSRSIKGEASDLFSVPRWWCHRGHVRETRRQQWHVDPGGLWRLTCRLTATRGFRQDKYFCEANTHKSYLALPRHLSFFLFCFLFCVCVLVSGALRDSSSWICTRLFRYFKDHHTVKRARW